MYSAGVRLDEDKVQAVLELPTPQSCLQLQGVLAVVHYLGRFIPNVSIITIASVAKGRCSLGMAWRA